MNKWQRVFSNHMSYKAEIVKAILEEHELNPVIMNKQDSNYKIGNFEVYVKPEEVLKAIKIIEDEVEFK